MSYQTEYKVLFSSTLAARHDLLVCELHVRWDIKHLKCHFHDNILEIHLFFFSCLILFGFLRGQITSEMFSKKKKTQQIL